MKQLGYQLKALRESAGLRYRDLNVHHNIIRNIENDNEWSKKSLLKYIGELENKSGYSIECLWRWEKEK